MSNMDAFLAGFLNKRTEINDTRRAEADDYYKTQLERARMFGTEGLKKRRERVQQATNMANNLRTNAGVPEHIIKAVANEGLENLADLQDIYERAAKNGVNLEAAYWEQAVPTAMEFRDNSGKPLGEFLKEAGGMYVDRVSKGEPATPASSVWDRLSGRSHMTDAQRKLDTTDIGDGFTASEALSVERQGDNNRVVSGGGYGTDLGYVYGVEADMEAQQKADAAANKGLTVGQISSIHTSFQKSVEEASATELRKLTQGGLKQGTPEYEEQAEMVREQVRARVAGQYSEIYEGRVDGLSFISPYLSRPSEAEATPEEAVAEPVATNTAPEGVPATMNSQKYGTVTFDSVDESRGVVRYRTDKGKILERPMPGAAATPAPEAAQPTGPAWMQALETMTNPEGKSQEELEIAQDNFGIPAGETPPDTFVLNGVTYTFKGIDDLGLATYAPEGDEGNDPWSSSMVKIPVLK